MCSISNTNSAIITALTTTLTTNVPVTSTVCLTGGTTNVMIKGVNADPVLFGRLRSRLRVKGPTDGLVPVSRLTSAVGRLHTRRHGVVFAGNYFSVLRGKRIYCLRGTGELKSMLVMKLGSSDSMGHLGKRSHPVGSRDTHSAILTTLRTISCMIVFARSAPLGLVGAITPSILMGNNSCTVRGVMNERCTRRAMAVPFMSNCSAAGAVNTVGRRGRWSFRQLIKKWCPPCASSGRPTYVCPIHL